MFKYATSHLRHPDRTLAFFTFTANNGAPVSYRDFSPLTVEAETAIPGLRGLSGYRPVTHFRATRPPRKNPRPLSGERSFCLSGCSESPVSRFRRTPPHGTRSRGFVQCVGKVRSIRLPRSELSPEKSVAVGRRAREIQSFRRATFINVSSGAARN